MQRLADGLPFPTVVIGADYRIKLANGAARDLFGGSDPVACGTTCHQLSHGRDTPCDGVFGPCPLQRVLATKSSFKVIHTHFDRHGSACIVEVDASPLLDERGEIAYVVETARDITEHVQMKNALQQSEATFRGMASAAQDAIIGIDHLGAISFWNDSAERIFGYSAREALGKDFHQLVTCPQDREQYFQALSGLRKTGRGAAAGKTVELTGVRKDGREVPIELSLSSILRDGEWHAVGIARDVTERRQAERLLREERDRAQEYLDIAGVILVALDTQGNITLMNPKGHAVLGYEQGELLGRNWFDTCIPEDDRNEVRTFFGELVAGRVRAQEYFENEVVTKSWEKRLIAWRSTALADGNGRIVGTLSSGEDITDRKSTEEALRTMDQQLRQSQKMEAVGALAGGIAHEFNNLLQAIQGYTKFAMDELAPESQPHEDLQQSLVASERAATLTRQLLNFSRQNSLCRTEVNPNELLSQLVQMVRPLIGENIGLKLALDETAETVLADPVTLQQALMNLCVNARDAMPSGGRLTIKTENTAITKHCARLYRGLRAGHYVRIVVSDTGCGMPPEVKERAFDPFFTTKEVGKGTGLGLAMVYGVVQEHGGLIDLYSEPGEGTTFKIYLPSNSRAHAAEESAASAATARGDETILVAEDDPLSRDVAIHVLEGAGYTTLTAPDGEEAVRLIRERGEQIDLVLLDFVTPRMSGEEAYLRIREIKPDVAVVFCTGYLVGSEPSGVLGRHGVPVIEKPFDPDVLLRTIRQSLDGPGDDVAELADSILRTEGCVANET